MASKIEGFIRNSISDRVLEIAEARGALCADPIAELLRVHPRAGSFQEAYVEGRDSCQKLKGKAKNYTSRYRDSEWIADRKMESAGWVPVPDYTSHGSYCGIRGWIKKSQAKVIYKAAKRLV